MSRTRALSAAVATVAVLLAAACQAEPDSATVRADESATGAPTPSPSPTPVTSTLVFAGDVHFTGRTLRLLDDPATAFGPVTPLLRDADFTMLNLETAVTTRGTAEPKQYLFRAPATAFDALRAAGVDVVSLANNHTLDYGQVGLADTFAAASAANFPIVGAGVNAQAAYAPLYTTVNGLRVALLAFSQVTELASTWVATDTRPGLALAISDAQLERAATAVRSARAEADVVIVFMHWGQEYNECPISLQKKAAAAFAQAGATAIVGTHAHVMQGDGWLGSTYVSYGMANFLWYVSNTPSVETGLYRLTLTGSTITSVEFVPTMLDSRTGQPIPATGADAERIQARHERLRGCTGLSAAPS